MPLFFSTMYSAAIEGHSPQPFSWLMYSALSLNRLITFRIIIQLEIWHLIDEFRYASDSNRFADSTGSEPILRLFVGGSGPKMESITSARGDALIYTTNFTPNQPDHRFNMCQLTANAIKQAPRGRRERFRNEVSFFKWQFKASDAGSVSFPGTGPEGRGVPPPPSRFLPSCIIPRLLRLARPWEIYGSQCLVHNFSAAPGFVRLPHLSFCSHGFQVDPCFSRDGSGASEESEERCRKIRPAYIRRHEIVTKKNSRNL